MSLHAQLSPEATTKVAAQRRTSTLTSLVIALLTMALLSIILLIIATASEKITPPPAKAYIDQTKTEEKLKLKKITNSISKKPAPSPTLNKVISVPIPSPTFVPITMELPGPPADIGDGDGFGIGGDGSGFDGSSSSNIPNALKKRCSHADRMQRLLSNGGNAECEDAVLKSLRWLKETQNKDGSWTQSHQVGMTGLALLTYLGHCETAQSEEFGESVLDAITYLVDASMKNNGKLATDLKDKHWPYEHAIATYALAEAYTLCVQSFGENIYQLEEAVSTSGQFLINSQHQSGGWEYDYSEDNKRGGDVSIVGWHLQAIKACKLTGLDFKNIRKSSNNGLQYLAKMQLSNGAIGYASPTLRAGQDGTTLAAVGALCAQIWKSPSHKIARKAVKLIDHKMTFNWNTPDSDLYGHYYAAQVMINHGGSEWERYNQSFRDQVLQNQKPDGSFRPVNGGKQKSIKAVAASFVGPGDFATHYRTCLATLMLESYYRFLPSSKTQ